MNLYVGDYFLRILKFFPLENIFSCGNIVIIVAVFAKRDEVLKY